MRKLMSLSLISAGSVFLANGIEQKIAPLLIGAILLIIGAFLAYWKQGENRHEISPIKEE